jgi:hypothetical protein
MDDFNVGSLHESKNEWCARLITLLTPLIVDGYKSILDEAINLCKTNDEMDKYLMTFQNFISRIPKWNPSIIEAERKRICDKSGCVYLEDLITCVHIIQLKILTAMRVGQKQKKIDINIPKLDDFIHKVYINVARKIYRNVYLFEQDVLPLQIQKHNRELEILIQEGILNTIRDSIPVEAILKQYMEQTIEEDVVEEIKEQIVEETAVKANATIVNPIAPVSPVANQIVKVNAESNVNPEANVNPVASTTSQISFDNMDYIKDYDNQVMTVDAPKTIERLEEISELRAKQRKIDEAEESDGDKIKIYDDFVNLDAMDIHVIDEPKLQLLPDLLLDDIEVLD